MAIKRIRAKNFKSFKELDVELGDLNILIGANASGKSNFVEIFRFLRDIRSSGLENAISLQGGIEYLRNVNIGSSEELSLEIVSDRRSRIIKAYGQESGEWAMEVYETIYEFAIAFDESDPNIETVRDKSKHKFNLIKLRPEEENIGPGEIVISSVNGKMDFDDIDLELPEEGLIQLDDIIPKVFIPETLPSGTLLSSSPFPMILGPGDIPVYNFDSRVIKEFAPIAAKVELEENGENLAVVLNNIMGKEDGKRKLLNLVTYLLDFVDDLSVERQMDKSFLLKLQETYSEEYLPANLISDGTVNMIALIVALYFGKKSLAIIEEPERGIHPHLISRAVHMMEDASRNKQIIVTTHNPEMVKHADSKDLLLISRDAEGFSSIIPRPSEKETVKIFLGNEIGIEDLYVKSLLEI